MNPINILVVEDDVDINNLLCKMLNRNGYQVTAAYSGSEAKMLLERYDYHLILLDLMLPGMSGEEIVSYVRKTKNMPIIVISAKSEQETKIVVLKIGADDFIVKPFDINEVLARVEAQLRRYIVFSDSKKTNPILIHKDLVLNRETMEITLKGVLIPFTVREFTLLELLMEHPNKVFTKANIFESVWKDTYLGDDNTVNVHISNIRSKLAKADSDNEYIHTVWGIGFKMKE